MDEKRAIKTIINCVKAYENYTEPLRPCSIRRMVAGFETITIICFKCPLHFDTCDCVDYISKGLR